MLSVSELAKLCQTSTTTIYRILKDVQQEYADCSTHLTEKHKGITHFTNEGERIIKERLNAVEQKSGERSTALNVLNTLKTQKYCFYASKTKLFYKN